MSSSEPGLAYRQPAAELIAALATDGRRGLEDAEAAARLERYGRNELAAEPPVPRWRRFLAQFEDVLVVLLLVATAISLALWFVERDAALPYEAIAIFAVVLLNATIGYLQEARAEAAVSALRAMSAAGARVVRGGERRTIAAAEVVPGDLVLIEEGDTIPADARLIESAALQTAEAALTGESLPVAKDTRPIDADAALGDRHNMVFSGTAATYGHGKAIVTATGMRTEMGRIAGLLEQTADEATPLQRELDRTGKVLGIVVDGDCRRDDCDHPPRRGRSGSVGAVRRVDSGCGACGGRRAGRAAGGRHRGPLRRRAADGAPQRDRPPPGRGGNARVGHRDRVGQDRHPHQERDDGARRRDGERARHLSGVGIRARGRGGNRRRRIGGRTASRRAGARPRDRGSREQRERAAAGRTLERPGRSDRGRAPGGRAEGRPEHRVARSASAAHWRGALLVGAEADEHAPSSHRAGEPRRRVHERRSRRAACTLHFRGRPRRPPAADRGAPRRDPPHQRNAGRRGASDAWRRRAMAAGRSAGRAGRSARAGSRLRGADWHDRSAPSRSARRGGSREARRHPPADDHGRSSAHRRGHRPGARHLGRWPLADGGGAREAAAAGAARRP